jgi:hypothetical protein
MSTPNRLEFRYYDKATTAWVEFQVDINPIEWDSKNSMLLNQTETIDGAPMYQVSHFDGRERTFTWKRLPNKEPYVTMINNFLDMRYVASGVEMRRNDLGLEDSTVWEPIRISDVQIEIGRGPQSATNALIVDLFSVRYSLRKMV